MYKTLKENQIKGGYSRSLWNNEETANAASFLCSGVTENEETIVALLDDFLGFNTLIFMLLNCLCYK